MRGSFQTQFISFPPPRYARAERVTGEWIKVPTPESKNAFRNFKTVFNSVFLVPTKTNTPHHMAVMEGCCVPNSIREEDKEKGRRDDTLHQQRLTFWCPFPDTWPQFSGLESKRRTAQKPKAGW